MIALTFVAWFKGFTLIGFAGIVLMVLIGPERILRWLERLVQWALAEVSPDNFDDLEDDPLLTEGDE